LIAALGDAFFEYSRTPVGQRGNCHHSKLWLDSVRRS